MPCINARGSRVQTKQLNATCNRKNVKQDLFIIEVIIVIQGIIDMFESF